MYKAIILNQYLIKVFTVYGGARVRVVVEALSYKPEGCGIASR
jgi:hypothetical protein